VYFVFFVYFISIVVTHRTCDRCLERLVSSDLLYVETSSSNLTL